MDWENEPATWKQLKFLRQHGYKPDRHLTKTAATELITQMGGHVPVETPMSAALVYQLPKQDAFLLHNAVDEAGIALSHARRETLQASEQNLALAISKRQMFWIDTCRDPSRMQGACGQVLELYRKFGCRFESPSNKQVQEVLSALDSAVPAWDRDHPLLFYQTLELNYPELVRRK
jgi:hypothetical protein